MTLQEMKNLAAQCDGQGVQLGRDVGCEIKMRNLRHGGLIKAGLRYPADTEFNDAFLLAEEQKGNIIMLANAKKINAPFSEDTYITDDNQVKTLDTKGLPEFEMIFEEGHVFYKNLAKLQSHGQYDFFFADEDDTIALCEYEDGIMGGFEAGHVTPGPTMPKVAGETEKKMLLVQLVDRQQYDNNMALFVKENHGISLRKHTGVSPILLSFTGNVGAGTGVQIKATLADRKSPASGLDGNYFQAMVGTANNIVVSATEVDNTGVYDVILTDPLVAGQVVSIRTWDQTLSVGNILLGTKLYFGSKIETTVV